MAKSRADDEADDDADDDDGPVQVDGCVIHTFEELRAWTKKHLAELVENRQMFNEPHYREARKALLDPTKRVVVGIIPCWNRPRMAELMEKFFAQRNDVVRVRRLFADIELLIGESNMPAM